MSDEIVDMMDFLLKMPLTFWDLYALQNDLISQRLSYSQQHIFAQEARNEAIVIALCKKKTYSQMTISEILACNGISVKNMPPVDCDSKVHFAIFEEPSLVYLNRKLTEICQQLLEQTGFDYILNGHSVEEIILAHELYHVIASAGEAPFIKKKHISVWKIGKFEIRKRITALEEVGAMAFTQEFLDLNLCPYVLDLPLTYCQSAEMAQSLYNRIINLWQSTKGGLPWNM